jgi:hypothetical protein
MSSKYLFLFLLAGVTSFTSASAQIPSNPPDKEEKKDSIEPHRPGSGFSLVNSKKGALIFSISASVRYLNQEGLDDTYTDAFGRTSVIDKRNDLQFQKLMLYFKGWLFTPKFRYVTYAWTSNTNLGLGAQVVLGGNFQYQVNKHFDFGVGIGAVPTNRTLVGNWPLWLRQDARTMSEEFFRGSFTSGLWMQGEIVKGLNYKTMIGNNLSQLGIDAGQLDDGFDTWGTSLWWHTNNYSQLGTYGDFEKHEKPATILMGSFTRSNETRQSQPGTEDPENSQIRLSDGTGIFGLGAFAPSTQVKEATYQMAAFNAGIKYKGFALDADYFIRRISNLKTVGQIPVSKLSDQGFDIQASAMLINKTLQLYGTGSYINGEYGKPSEINLGLNWFPFKTRALRLNSEVIFANNSPVGYLSYPTVVGANGKVYMISLELFY